MMHFIRGTLIEKHPTGVVIETHGIGYALAVSVPTYSALPAESNDVFLYTYMHIREDAWQLYGFATQSEKDIFKLIISVSGIGPKGALTVLSGIGTDHFRAAVLDQDIDTLVAVPGIGRKTAERIIVELKEKIASHASAGGGRAARSMPQAQGIAGDAVVALMSLGYKRQQAQDAVQKSFADGKHSELTVEELIRQALTRI